MEMEPVHLYEPSVQERKQVKDQQSDTSVCSLFNISK